MVIDKSNPRLNCLLHLSAFYEAKPYHTNRFDCSNKEIIKARPSQRERERDWVVVDQVTRGEKRNEGGWGKADASLWGWFGHPKNKAFLFYFRFHFSFSFCFSF
jgi:hypothetical protein